MVERSQHNTRRSFRRWSVGLALAVVLATGALVAKELHWAYTAKAIPTVNYRAKFMDLVSSRNATGVDGMPALLRAAELYNQWEEEYSPVNEENVNQSSKELLAEWADISEVCHGAFPRENLAEELRALAALDALGVTAAIAEAARADHFAPVITTDPDAAVQSDIAVHNIAIPKVALRGGRLSMYSLARMRVLATAGEWDAAADSLGGAFASAIAAGSLPLPINATIGSRNVELAMNNLRWLLSDTKAPAAACAGFLREIERRAHQIPSMTNALEGERLYSLDGIQHAYSGEEGGDGRCIRTEYERIAGYDPLYGSPWDWGPHNTLAPPLTWIDNLLWWKLPSRARAVQDANSLLGELIRDSKIPRGQRTFQEAIVVESAHSATRELIKETGGTLNRFIGMSDSTASVVAASRIMLAIELYRADHGKPPPTLEALVPVYLSKLPTDPYAPDGLFRYRPEPTAQPWAAFDYTLYSIGEDGVDDNLKPAQAAISEELLGPEPGTDWPFTTRRPNP